MMKRAFVIKSNTAITEFKREYLYSLASLTGRLDVVIRALIAALLGPKGIREEVIFYAILEGPPNPPLTLMAKGSELKYLPLSEEEVAKAIYTTSGGSNTWLKVEKKGLKEVMGEVISSGYKVIYLVEDGVDIGRYEFREEESYCFIVGDQKGLSKEDEEFLEEIRAVRVSLGPLPYLSSHCIIYVNTLLDRIDTSP
ncbi:MAG: hypothetical protein B6U69_03685 [Thermofilum sp. ex4484_15]|nr:MAG: hypothetical protein B6U69_03685 [Thermofilum sp. ex4484_15]